MQDPQMVARILSEKSVNGIFYFVGIIVALPMKGVRCAGPELRNVGQ
jgi:hypothetical protein